MNDLGIDDHIQSSHASAIHTAGHVDLAARTCAPQEFLSVSYLNWESKGRARSLNKNVIQRTLQITH